MPPNNYPQQPGSPQDPFAFIQNNPARPPSRFSGPTSVKGRLIVVSVGVVVLIIIFVIIMSILGQAGKGQNQAYTEIAQRQTEIIRLSTLAEQKAKLLETRSYATTIRMSFTTSQADMTSVLASHGVSQKTLNKQLSASKNSKSDATLTEAEKNNRFDETWTELINNEINNYKKQLNTVSGGASAQDRSILQNAFNQASTLQGPSKQGS